MYILLFANGDFTPTSLPEHDLIIAADGGARHVRALGKNPDVIIGDLDSLSLDEVAAFEQAGSKVLRYSPEKDETDLELALDYAAGQGAAGITCFGLFGGRWDMSFANLLLLADPRYAAIDFRIQAGDTAMFILRGDERRTPDTGRTPGDERMPGVHSRGAGLTLRGSPGDTVSVIPLDGPAEGLTYTGLAWALADATLPFGSPRGVSNVMESETASVSLRSGVVLITHTGRKD